LTYWFKANLDDGSAEKKKAAAAGRHQPKAMTILQRDPRQFWPGSGSVIRTGTIWNWAWKNADIFTLSLQAKY
jgi:hypothetical protein